MKILRNLASLATVGALALGSMVVAPEARAAEAPGETALEWFRGEQKRKDIVQNRFFLKEGRFEMAPVMGYVPNNPMVRRYVGGVLLGYHFSESFSAGAQLLYSPDLGETDLKDLTKTLVYIANSSDANIEFQQPLDKMTLGATFSANWAPIYGKINLVGATVLNFDLYGSLGLGMLTINSYYATSPTNPVDENDIVDLSVASTKVRVPLNVGAGMDFFLNQTVALKIDARSYIYVDEKPQYDPNIDVTESRLYNNFIASAGLSIFIPKMKPRLTYF